MVDKLPLSLLQETARFSRIGANGEAVVALMKVAIASAATYDRRMA
jgi:hypothetical protein